MVAPLFDTVLVANRGEIARRVIRTLQRLDIRSVAVFSDADADAPHVREADLAVRIGPAAASASYLDIDAVVAAALSTGAQAVHPGYGFLSENPAFAAACEAAGTVFIGPSTRALDVMGDKIRAREHVAAHGVPIVPGFGAAGLTDREILASAEQAGFPLLIKPAAGGGGKGMQLVGSPAELPEALAAARRIARASFGDDTLLLERVIERPRHIEVQVLADAHGRIVHLGERECTLLQRRHQKVIEEAPSPIVDAVTRERLGSAACAAAASVDYRGAGTVEFLVAAARPDEFFFIEMNARLQVEHPVTELVTGIDLVEQQLRVAAGEPLGLTQDDIRMTGHAVEARVYAESPERGFLPSTGEIMFWRGSDTARVDSAVETGSVITADYDPMIAKVIAWGDDRESALEGLDAALVETVLLGVDSNHRVPSIAHRRRRRAVGVDGHRADRSPRRIRRPRTRRHRPRRRRGRPWCAPGRDPHASRVAAVAVPIRMAHRLGSGTARARIRDLDGHDRRRSGHGIRPGRCRRRDRRRRHPLGPRRWRGGRHSARSRAARRPRCACNVASASPAQPAPSCARRCRERWLRSTSRMAPPSRSATGSSRSRR